MRHLPALLLLLPLTAMADPPPGHPSAQEGSAILGLPQAKTPADLIHRGKVISAMDANQYTYIEVETDKGPLWLAAPLVRVKPGDWIRYSDGGLTHQWYSKLLKRSFDTILFVDRAVVEQ
jgi:hypothetical protein